MHDEPHILDVDKPLNRMTDDQQHELVAKVRNDFKSAESTRVEREERAISDYELYARKRRDTEAQRVERGGWSKLEVPLIYWQIEQKLARAGVQPPTITVTPKTSEAVPYAQAKQMRLQHYLDTCGWDIPYQMIQRSKFILGDGIAKVPWNRRDAKPRLLHVDWFDFFFSAEATLAEEAECFFHRTYWTPRQLLALEDSRDEDGRKLWHNLDDVAGGQERSMVDNTWARRRAISDQSPGASVERGSSTEMMPVIECWYITGEYVVLAGPDYATPIRAGMSPFRRRLRNGDKIPVRPFVFFRNIPDLTGPYSLSECAVLEDHQIEISTLRNQSVDQITANINSPVVFDETIPAEEVEEAFSRPKGMLGVPWTPTGPGIMRMGPGQLAGDLPMFYNQIRDEASLASGMNENSAGQAVQGEQTATEVNMLVAEGNKRMQLARRMDEIAMGHVGRLFDSHDRQYGVVVEMPVSKGFTPSEGSQGFTPSLEATPDFRSLAAGNGAAAPGADFSDGFARIGVEVNGSEMDYQIEIDGGSAMRADQMEEAQKINAFVLGPASHPMIQGQLDWPEIARMAIAAYGQNPDRLMLPPPPPGMPMPGAPMDAHNGGPPQPGEVPLGPPIPLGPGGHNG